ncbi:hypothetical protein F4861DRAFT_504639 [Xylaria intraflava]|nr:hypothetical protein F4861DRAFT_504639 [Xylaria intraflava]
MFELPETKRVRREDVFESASSGTESDQEGDHNSEAESELRAKLNAQLSGLLDFSFAADPEVHVRQTDQTEAESESQPPIAPGDAQQETEHPEEEAFAFRLFRDQAPTHTVVLTQDEDPTALGEGGFVVPSRPRSYYIAPAPSSRQVSEYRGVAVSAEYILADAKKRRWGLEKPWRVIHILADSDLASKPVSGEVEGSVGKKRKRTRPGKKHRILLRMKEKTAREREEASKKMALDKEQHLQEKKKRLNRERKLKRRQKEREKKAEVRTGHSDGGGAADEKDDDE